MSSSEEKLRNLLSRDEQRRDEQRRDEQRRDVPGPSTSSGTFLRRPTGVGARPEHVPDSLTPAMRQLLNINARVTPQITEKPSSTRKIPEGSQGTQEVGLRLKFPDPLKVSSQAQHSDTNSGGQAPSELPSSGQSESSSESDHSRDTGQPPGTGGQSSSELPSSRQSESSSESDHSRDTGQPQETGRGEEYDRSKERPETALSAHETVLHDSAERISESLLASFTKTNEGIAEINSKFQEAHAGHLAKSKEEILRTATVALDRAPKGQTTKALLLGVGNGLDIPLQELAEKFDHLTVVELDGKSTEKAIKQLSPDLQKKFRLVVADVTGIIGEYCEKIDGISDNSRYALSFFHKAEQMTKNAIEEPIGRAPDVGNDYAFVSSHLLLSQLGYLPRQYAGNIVRNKFTYSEGVDSGFLKSYSDLTTHLHKEHIRYLAKSVAPRGTVHFADTYVGISQTSSTEPERRSFLVVPEVIDAVLKENFTPVKEETGWRFNHTPGERQFLIKSHALELKPGDAEA